MLSAASPAFFNRPTNLPLLRDVRAAYRRVCVLRAAGKEAEADELMSGKLAALLSRARELPEISESQLENIFSREEDRVDTAYTLAEVLLPLLTPQNGIATSARAQNFSSVRDSYPAALAGNEARGGPDSDPIPSASNTGPMLPGIADFIDEMLTQERGQTGPRSDRRSA